MQNDSNMIAIVFLQHQRNGNIKATLGLKWKYFAADAITCLKIIASII